METETKQTTEPQFEIVPASAGIAEPQKHMLVESFAGFFEQAERWKAQTENITDAKLARTARLELKSIRVEAEKTRKRLKEDSLRMGKAIDGANNVLLALIVPIEKAMEDVEKQEERRAAIERAKREEDRMELLRPFLDPAFSPPSVADMSDEMFAKVLSDAKLLQAAKIAEAKRVEEDRIAKEKAEAEERERIRVENEKLKAEAAAKEAELKAEREAAEKARAAAEAKAATERAEAEKRLAAEREAAAKREAEAEAKRKAERDAEEKARAAAAAKDKAEREAAEAAARKEREEIEAKAVAAEKQARKDREALEKKLKAEQEAKAKAEREAKDAREKAAAEAREKADADAKAAREAEEAAKKAAAAPDREKILGFSMTVKALTVPTMATDAGKAAAAEIAKKVKSFAKWIGDQAP